MGLNPNLPVLVPAIITLIVISVAAGLVLAWNDRPQIRMLVSRAWIVGVVIIVSSVGIFWISTAMVEGPKRTMVPRTLQQQQQEELRQRLKEGGH
ncbi:MAG TPA: hypothetical protein VKB71_10205 [Rhizomicrobium sp.]|nr:hypothetical protein [Rhizomicrobium sp.]